MPPQQSNTHVTPPSVETQRGDGRIRLDEWRHNPPDSRINWCWLHRLCRSARTRCVRGDGDEDLSLSEAGL